MIITNNPLVQSSLEKLYCLSSAKILFLDCNVENLLTKVRDMIYEGYALITHPLPASIGMIHSPYRSVILSNNKEKLDAQHAEIAESSLAKYISKLNHRALDKLDNEDYKRMDIQLLTAALNELSIKSQGGIEV